MLPPFGYLGEYRAYISRMAPIMAIMPMMATIRNQNHVYTTQI
ncbi:MAG: hypothetical protein ACFFCI_07850 [Promethearchaeota archaeon]